MYVLKLSYIFYCKKSMTDLYKLCFVCLLVFFNGKKETKENGRLSGKNCKLLIFLLVCDYLKVF